MKIVQSVQQLYGERIEYCKIISNIVRDILSNRKNELWHFTSRIKTGESFAQKLETGRYDTETIFEDLYACTLVVQNMDEISEAESCVGDLFDIVHRKPESDTETTKWSNSFPFDDLRLYCRLGQKSGSRFSEHIASQLFEVQIKTFMQHAWAIATHDIIYKTDEINWGKERIAYQVKAALEQAEVAISGAKLLSSVKGMAKESEIGRRVNQIVQVLDVAFNTDELPRDKRRLAQNIENVLTSLRIPIERMQEVLQIENDNGGGSHLKNMSPYQIVVAALYAHESQTVTQYITGPKNRRCKLFLCPEMNIPDTVTSKSVNVIKL